MNGVEEYNILIANILSIKQDNSVNGHFILGTGSIQDVQYYFYYYNTDKGIKLDKVKSDKSYIIETDEYEPSIYKVKETGKELVVNDGNTFIQIQPSAKTLSIS